MPTIPQSTAVATGSRARVQRYRSTHRRIDYVPSPDVLKIVEDWLERGLNNCHAGVIDHLILAGHRAMSGNAGAGGAPGDSEGSARAREAAPTSAKDPGA